MLAHAKIEAEASETSEHPIIRVATLLTTRGSDGGEPIERNDLGLDRVDDPRVRGILAEFAESGYAPVGRLRYLLAILKKYRRQIGELGYEIEFLEEAARSPWHGEARARAVEDAVDEVDPVYGDVEITVDSVSPDDWHHEPVAIPPMESILGPDGIIAAKLTGYESRPGQVQLAQAVADALTSGECLAGEAGTGVGKSLGYLIPAIYSGAKTIVSTEGKALQDQLSRKDLPFLADTLGVPVDYTILKGISNYVCELKWSEEQATLPTMGAVVDSGLHRWHRETQTGDLAELPVKIDDSVKAAITTSSDDCVGMACDFATSCWVLKAKQRAKEAQIVVVNHTLLCLDLALRAATDDGVSILPDRDQVIVDEAHSLEDVATGAFTTEVSEFSVPTALRGRLPVLAGLTDEELAPARDENARYFSIFRRDDRPSFRFEPTEDMAILVAALAKRLEAFALRARRSILDQGGYPEAVSPGETLQLKKIQGLDRVSKRDNVRRELYARRLNGLADKLVKLTEPIDDHVLYCEKERTPKGDEKIVVKRAPISVANDLRDALWLKWPTIATSATITTNGTFDYFRGRVGLDEAREVMVESPFDYRRNAVVYLPQDAERFDPTKDRYGADYYDALAERTRKLLDLSDGRAFCLFTSRRAMNEVLDRVTANGGLPWTVLVQGEYGTVETIRRFKEDGRAVLFGLRSFMTGVDVQGEALSLVILDKLPFPTPDDPVFAARCEALTKQTGDTWAWFTKLALPTATITLKQAVGRLIRSRSDRGAIALLDGRLSSKSYSRGILASLPPARQARSLSTVQSFFGVG